MSMISVDSWTVFVDIRILDDQNTSLQGNYILHMVFVVTIFAPNILWI